MGEFGGRLVMSGPDADNLRPMIDFYERPTGFDEGVTNVLREAPARRANTSRRASGAAHDLHYDHEDGSGWEMAPEAHARRLRGWASRRERSSERNPNRRESRVPDGRRHRALSPRPHPARPPEDHDVQGDRRASDRSRTR